MGALLAAMQSPQNAVQRPAGIGAPDYWVEPQPGENYRGMGPTIPGVTPINPSAPTKLAALMPMAPQGPAPTGGPSQGAPMGSQALALEALLSGKYQTPPAQTTFKGPGPSMTLAQYPRTGVPAIRQLDGVQPPGNLY